MTKIEIVHALKDLEKLETGQAQYIVNLFFNSIAQALIEGDRSEIRGFCSFGIKSYPAYTGRNPKTGEKIHVKEKKQAVFRAGQELKYRVNSCGQTIKA